MPTLFEYLGITVFFFSDDHLPIHVHAEYGKYYMKALLHTENGKVKSIEYLPVGNKPIFPEAKQKDFVNLVEKYKQDIVEKWIDFLS